MDKLAILAQVEALPGKEDAVEAFLKSALTLAQQEPGTTTWFALKLGPNRFGIFDTFPDEAARTAHLHGEIATALLGPGRALLAADPTIEMVDLLAVKS